MSAGNVLIADKDAISRASTKGFLEKNNYKVCEAQSIQDAARQDLSIYGALIVDLSPNDIAPEEVIRYSAGTPVIITSAQASLRHAVQTMKAGAADYLAKPYNPTELLESLENLIQQTGTVSRVVWETSGESRITTPPPTRKGLLNPFSNYFNRQFR